MVARQLINWSKKYSWDKKEKRFDNSIKRQLVSEELEIQMITTIFENHIQELITMKNYLLTFAAIPLLFACNPEDNPSEVNNNSRELIVTAEASEVDYASATLYGYANIPEGMTGVTFGIIFSKDENPTVGNGKVAKSYELDRNNKFYCLVTDLGIGTTYYYKAYLKEGDFYHTGSKTLSFTTKSFTAESIVTENALKITYDSATLKGSTNLPTSFGTERFGIILSKEEDPTIDNGIVIKSDEWDDDYSFSCNVTNLTMETKYYYKAFFVHNGEYRTGKTLSFTTKDIKAIRQEAVDLGLSVKWGTCNIGSSNPLEYGDYYAWGETETKKNYNWNSYKWGKYATQLTKYCTDDKTVLEPEDDVAHVKLGDKWRMPTDVECAELCEKCTWEWKSMNGINGRKVTGPNGNSIFLPAAGYYNADRLYSVGSVVEYWSSSLYLDNPHYARDLFSVSLEVSVGYPKRYEGRPVRPVSE